MKKEEFCLNSNQWIRFMIINRPPKSCPYATDNFSNCDDCSYRVLRTPTRYFIRKKESLRRESYIKNKGRDYSDWIESKIAGKSENQGG